MATFEELTASLDQIDASLDAGNASLDAIEADIQALKDQLAAGGLTPAQEAAIGDRITALTSKTAALAAELQATDEAQ